jgi:hypothetical protein
MTPVGSQRHRKKKKKVLNYKQHYVSPLIGEVWGALFLSDNRHQSLPVGSLN